MNDERNSSNGTQTFDASKELMKMGITKKQLQKIMTVKKVKPKILKYNISDKVFTVGVASDAHLCSTHEKIDELYTFYEICKKEKISVVLNPGDLVAGWNVYKGQENEVHTFGVDNQIEYAIKNYPKVEGITTYFITGNHDLSWLQLAGVDIGNIIEKKRGDMVYLGPYQGDIKIQGVKFRLHHSDRGGAYALSYHSQKIAEQIPSGNKPHILIFGHWHTALYYFYRNIHIFNAGAFEGQSLYLLRKGINPTIGGWTIMVRIADDNRKTILSITPTFIPFIRKSGKNV